MVPREWDKSGLQDTVAKASGLAIWHAVCGWLVGESLETQELKIDAPCLNEAYHDSHLVVVCYNGFVLIAGQVADKVLKADATEVVRQIKGVRKISNELEIGSPTTALTRTNDAWLTTRIKSSLLANSDVTAGRIKVVTENSVVYLMGLVTQKEADKVTDIAATTTGVRRVVRLFELLD